MISSCVIFFAFAFMLGMVGSVRGSASQTSDMNSVQVSCESADSFFTNFYQCKADWTSFPEGGKPKDLLHAFVEKYKESLSYSVDLPSEGIEFLPEAAEWEAWFAPFYGFDPNKAEDKNDFIKTSLFLDYYSNNTFASMEKSGDNIFGYSSGLYPLEQVGEDGEIVPDFLTVDMMNALRDISIRYDVTFPSTSGTNPVKAHVFGYLGTSIVNAVYFEENAEVTNVRPVAIGTTQQRGWMINGATMGDWAKFRIAMAKSNVPSAWEMISMIAVAPLSEEGISLDEFQRLFNTSYPVGEANGYPGDNNCFSLANYFENGALCNPNNLPPYMFAAIDLAGEERTRMMLSRYSRVETTECEQMWPMKGDMPDTSSGETIEKTIFLLNGNDFMNPEWDNSTHHWVEGSWCQTERNTTYIEYELYWYSAPYGMLSGFPSKDYNKDNMYQGIRQWPTRNNYTAFVVSANKGSADKGLIAKVQVCENVFSDTHREDVAGCLDVSSPWDTGVFVGSLIGILIVIGVWVWGGLTAKAFKAHVPDYYWYLERYQPEFLRQQEEIAKARRAQKEAKKAAKAQKSAEKDGGEKIPLNREATGTSGDSLTGSDSDAQYK